MANLFVILLNYHFSGTLHLDDLILKGSTSTNKNKVAEICLQISFDAPQVIIFTSVRKVFKNIQI